MQNRVFFPQAALDQWLVDGNIELGGDEVVLLPERRKFRIVEAIRVLSEVGAQSDSNGLVGKVKTKESLVELGAEVMQGSMLIGDNAYDVVEGWLGVPSVGAQPPPGPSQNHVPVSEEVLLDLFVHRHC